MRTPSPRRTPRGRLGFLVFAFTAQLAPLHGEPENPPLHTADLHAQATARMDRWFEPDDHAANLLRHELSAIFRDWGRRDLPGAEAFIRGPRWTPCDSSDPDDMRVALHYAALIGASPADPALAWRKLMHHEKARDQFMINPGNIPYSHEIAARFLFQAYHHADPADAVAFLRQMPLNLKHITAPAWGVVLARTPDAATRATMFGEMPQHFHVSPAVLAGLAEVDPQDAWQRIGEIPLEQKGRATSDSRQSVGWEWIKHWAYHQPEQTLRFLATLEMDDEAKLLRKTCFFVITDHHPAYITRSMESLREKLYKFNFDSFSASLCENRPYWKILDGPPPLSPVERYKIMAVTLRTADLPPDFKARLFKVRRAALHAPE